MLRDSLFVCFLSIVVHGKHVALPPYGPVICWHHVLWRQPLDWSWSQSYRSWYAPATLSTVHLLKLVKEKYNEATPSFVPTCASAASIASDIELLRGAGAKRSAAAIASTSDPSDSPRNATSTGLQGIVKNLHERTWSSLDLHVIQKSLAERCDTVRANQLALSPHFAQDVAEVHKRYQAVKEVWTSKDIIPINHPMDIEHIIMFAARGNVPELEDLREVGKALTVITGLSEHLSKAREEEMPQLRTYAEGITLPYELTELLTDAFDNDGRLSGAKFPEVRRLRLEAEQLYGTIKSTVTELMKANDMSSMMTDEYIAQRNGRFVLPLKNTYKRSGVGILQDQSSSGRTVYVEPMQVVEPTNELKRKELELQQEQNRITREMSRLIAVSKDDIMASLDAVALIDISVARAGLADTMQGIIPEVGTEGVMMVEDARHPVLVIRERHPVGNSLHIGPESPGLVLTGPNAGGKTIVLKLLGLLALLVRLGIPIPARRNARVDFFSPILADIGDMQSVTGDLSTFSGHLLVCREVLRNAASGALVLMDEMGSGTDPAQGVAIAQALLEALLNTGARVAITTHYIQLKELAKADRRFVVGAMEFLNGKPTYRFQEGAVGESYALEVADQLGLPPAILSRARSLVDANVLKVTELIKELESQRDELQAEISSARGREEALQEEQRRMQQQVKELQDRQVELDRLKYRAKLEVAEDFRAQLAEEEKKLEQIMRNVGSKEKAAFKQALQDLGKIRGNVDDKAKPDVQHIPAGLRLLSRDDELEEGEVVTCAGDELNASRSGKVARDNGQNVDVVFTRAGLDIVVTFKKTELARAPQEVVIAM